MEESVNGFSCTWRRAEGGGGAWPGIRSRPHIDRGGRARSYQRGVDHVEKKQKKSRAASSDVVFPLDFYLFFFETSSEIAHDACGDLVQTKSPGKVVPFGIMGCCIGGGWP